MRVEERGTQIDGQRAAATSAITSLMVVVWALWATAFFEPLIDYWSAVAVCILIIGLPAVWITINQPVNGYAVIAVQTALTMAGLCFYLSFDLQPASALAIMFNVFGCWLALLLVFMTMQLVLHPNVLKLQGAALQNRQRLILTLAVIIGLMFFALTFVL